MAASIERESVGGVRWYYDGDAVDESTAPEDVGCVSVSEVLKFLDEDETGLEVWRDRNDGKDDNPHHQHLLWYSQHRGTLCHYYALATVIDVDLWSHEETESMRAIQNGPDEEDFYGDDTGVPATKRAVAYSVMHKQGAVDSRDEFEDEYEDATLEAVLDYDVTYFTETFEDICLHLGITNDSVIAVERKMLAPELGYGGQTDLVYEDPNGNVVVADLKTSGGLRWKHRLQAVAYAKSVVYDEDLDIDTVDRIEVIRIDPDERGWQIHAPYVPEHVQNLYREGRPSQSKYTDDFWFEDYYGEFSYDSIDEMWQHFCRLVQEAREEYSYGY